jgi:hypothetical protein
VKHCNFDNDAMKCLACGKVAKSRSARSNCLASAAAAVLQQPSGPGTELSKLLKRFGIEPTPTCQCRAKAAEMDAWGCDECSRPERIEEVVAVMREEAKARGLPFLDAAGRMLVKRAIANARRASSASLSQPSVG